MKYLMRAARRLSTTGAPAAGAAKLRPAMPSRSPLAEADQRLNIDWFAEHFDVPVVRERTAPAPEEDEPAFSGSDRAMTRHPAAARPPSPTVEPPIAPSEPVVSAVQPTPKSENAPARGKPGGEAPAQVSPPSTTRAARPPQQAAARDSEHPSFAEKATVLPDRSPPEPPARRVNAPDPAGAEGRSPAPDHSPMERVNAAKQERALQSERATDSALNRAMRWVEGRAREAKRGGRRKESSSPGSQPRLGELVEARPVRATPRDTRPITHLEIGKIEIEVAPPVKSAQGADAPRPRPKASGSRSASRRGFGWRQR